MKKIAVILFVTGLCTLHVSAQTLESNNVTQDSKSKVLFSVRDMSLTSSEFIADTTTTFANHVMVEKFEDYNKRVNPVKTVGKPKNDANAKLQKKVDSLIAVRQFDIIKRETKRYNDSTDSVRYLDDKLEYDVIHSIETINYYRGKIDSTKSVANKSDFMDSIVNIQTKLKKLAAKQQRISNSLTRKIEENTSEKDIDTIKLARWINDMSDYKKSLKGMNGELKECDSTWLHYTKKYIVAKPKDKTVKVAALPFFNTIPGLREYNGSLNVIGSNVPKTKAGNYVEFGLFTGLLKAADSSNSYIVFISEVSNYAFYYKSNIGLMLQADSAKKLALNSSVYFLNKPINKDSTRGIINNFNASFFQGKFGLEYIVYKNLFSAYINGNAIGVVTNKDQFDKRFGVETDIITYADFGFRMLLNPTMDLGTQSAFKLYFDLNFIINDGDLRKFNANTNDILVPNFRVGLRADLGSL